MQHAPLTSSSPPTGRLVLGLLYLSLVVWLSGCSEKVPADAAREDWISLFNGRDLSGWIPKINHHQVGVNYGNTFRVEDGVIKVRYDEYGDFGAQFGHIYYEDPFSHFRLVVEYRFVGEVHRGAPEYVIRNSGAMFHSQDPRTMRVHQNWPISIEMQFLGGLEEGRSRPTGNMCSPGTEIVYNGSIYPGHCLTSSSETYYGDQWVRAELIVLGDSLVTHVIEGDTVLQYSHPQIGGNVVENFDPEFKQDGKPLTEGFVALQSEGQPIDFRRVELLNLTGCMDPDSPSFRSYFVEPLPAACR